jgi:hypothetical protein
VRELPEDFGRLSKLVDLRLRKNRIVMLPESMGDFDAGDPNDLMHWMEPGHGLCIFDRRDNPMVSPPRDHFLKHWSIEQVLEFLRDPPVAPKPIRCQALKDGWAYINAPPIHYNMTPEGLEDAGHHEDPHWEEHHGFEAKPKPEKQESAAHRHTRQADEQFNSMFDDDGRGKATTHDKALAVMMNKK